MPNFFDPSMVIGGAVKKNGCMHFWNHVLSKKIGQNGQKVKFETLLKFSKNSIFLAQNTEKGGFLDLERPIK